ncbi:MAG: hypothetical protein HEEMFOPI_01798 [Holosporales bacterium]
MPYKEKLNNVSKNARKKSKYKVTNWSEYNKNLKNRGKISLYFPTGDIKSQFINELPYVKKVFLVNVRPINSLMLNSPIPFGFVREGRIGIQFWIQLCYFNGFAPSQ